MPVPRPDPIDRMPAETSHEPPGHPGPVGRIDARDRHLLESPAGREDDRGIVDPTSEQALDILDKPIGAIPQSEITSDAGPGMGDGRETIDGLDPTEEAVRRMAEDVPTPGRIDD